MSLAELEMEVQNLSPGELSAFTRWLDDYTASRWDTQLDEDITTGKLEKLGAKADRAFESGQCTEW